MTKLALEFITETVTWAAATRTFRASALNHEAVDYAVEDQTIVEVSALVCLLATFSEVDEIPNSLWAFFNVQIDGEISHGGVKNSFNTFDVFFVL